MKKRFYLLIVTLCSVCCLWAKPSTEGTEFWVTFMNNYKSNGELKLIASSRYDATITVKNPQTNWTTTFTVQANKTAEQVVPNEQAYTFDFEKISKRGLQVTANKPISLYASNFQDHTYDATIVMSTNGLGMDYVVQAFENVLGTYGRELAVVGTDNNTVITITPSARTSGGKIKGVPFQITLNKGETYQIMSLDDNADFSGTRIEASKNVAVFSGHQCINVPTGNPWCDHIVEQQMPTQMWGKQFAITKTKGQNGDYVMITASADNTTVKLNGTLIATLKEGESHQFRLTDESGFIETSQPSAVFIYLEGSRDNNMIGDPASVHVSPIEQMIEEMTFATFQTSESRTHYVNIVTTIAGAENAILDGASIADQFQPLKGNNKLRFAQINIPHATHTLKTSKEGFIAHVYGLGWCESYAYTIGSATINLNGQIVVNDIPRADIQYNDAECYKEKFTFTAAANTVYNTISWDLGDGTKSTQDKVEHTYAAPGDYVVTMIISNDEGKDTAKTYLHLVDELRDTVYATICKGDNYQLGTQKFSTAGTYNVNFTSKAGCDSIVTLVLNVNDTYLSKESAVVRMGSAYRWHWNWYREAGVYYDTLVARNGCDSIVELTLTLDDPSDIGYDTICYQPTYTFHGETYNLPDISDVKDADYIDYTIEYRDLDECVMYQMNLAISTILPGDYEIFDTIQEGMVYNFYGQDLYKSGTYYATASSGAGCEQNYTLHLTTLSFPIIEEELALCTSEQITWRNKTYSKPGIYNDTVFIPAGIEAVYRLILTDNRSIVEEYVNTTGSYVWNGKTYTESGIYTAPFKNQAGCDSIVTLHLGIGEPCKVEVEENETLCSGQSLKWNGQTITKGGDYTYTVKTSQGCDSTITLHVDLVTVEPTVINAEICEGDFYRYNGQKLTEEKSYDFHFTSVSGCDSLVTIVLTHSSSYHFDENQTVFKDQSIEWHGKIISKAGTYYDAHISKNGCDSIYVLKVKMGEKEIRPRTINADICEGDVYDFYGEQLTTSVSGYQHKIEYAEYDSIITLNLAVHEAYTNLEETQTIKQGESINWNGMHLTEQNDYVFNGKTQYGCDSIVTLHLNVTAKDIRPREVNADICEGDVYDFYGEQLTTSVSGYQHKIEYTEYDSIITLNLAVHEAYTNLEETQTIKQGESIDWNGMHLTEQNDYVFNGKTQYGCDSIVTLHLFVTEKTPRVEKDNDVICEGEYVMFYGEKLTTSGTYSHTEETDDEIVTTELTLTVNPTYNKDTTIVITEGESIKFGGKTLTQADTYTFEGKTKAGCDSIVTLHLIVEPKVEKPVCPREYRVDICKGDRYKFYGTSLTESDTYIHRFETEDCDSVVILTLVVHKRATTDISGVIPWNGSYEYNGKEYTKAGTYKITLTSVYGCDSIINLTLTKQSEPELEPIEVHSLYIPNACADQGFIDLQVSYTGKVDSIKVRFSGRDNGAGFKPTTVRSVSASNPIAHTAKAGHYKATLQYMQNKKVARTDTATFTLYYPSSVLEQGWDDVIAVLTYDYNGGYNFKEFQWYKDGELLEGETGSYIYQPLTVGSAYQALLTERNGLQLITCPLIVTPEEVIEMFPTQVRRSEKVRCIVSRPAHIYIYDLNGKQVMQAPLESGETDQVMPNQEGIYLVKIKFDENTTNDKKKSERNFKIVVR